MSIVIESNAFKAGGRIPVIHTGDGPDLSPPLEWSGVPAGAQGGQRLRVRGKGLPIPGGGRGDLYVVLRLQVPAEITPAERELWQKLAQTSAFRPRD